MSKAYDLIELCNIALDTTPINEDPFMSIVYDRVQAGFFRSNQDEYPLRMIVIAAYSHNLQKIFMGAAVYDPREMDKMNLAYYQGGFVQEINQEMDLITLVNQFLQQELNKNLVLASITPLDLMQVKYQFEMLAGTIGEEGIDVDSLDRNHRRSLHMMDYQNISFSEQFIGVQKFIQYRDDLSEIY